MPKAQLLYSGIASAVFIFTISVFLTPPSMLKEKEDKFAARREAMVEQLKEAGIRDERVLAAMLKIKRHLFVDPDLVDEAYENRPLPIGKGSGAGQTISQPYIVAYMTEALALNETDRVLEIGTGSGYQAAILAEIASEVYTVEIAEDLADAARERLEGLGYHNIHVRHGDGFEGWAEFAPFDCIIVTAAPEEVPPALIGQLKVGGRMIIPIGPPTAGLFSKQELCLIIKKGEHVIERKKLLDVSFVPMIRGKEK